MNRAWILVLAAIASMPTALAIPTDASGSYLLSGAFNISGPAEASGHLTALLMQGTTPVSSLEIRAERAFVCTFYEQLTVLQGPTGPVRIAPPPDRDCAWHHQVTIHGAEAGETAGWLGVYPRGPLVFQASTNESEWEGPKDTRLASPGYRVASSADREAPEDPFYAKHITTPHLAAELSGGIHLSGPALTKIMGPDVQLSSAEGSWTYETGEETTEDSGMVQVSSRWFTIEYEKGTARFETESPYRLAAASDARISWDGTLSGTPEAGALETLLALYPSTGRREHIEGRFDATVSPAPGDERTNLELQGVLRSTTIAAARAYLPRTPADFATPAIVGVLGVLALVAVGAVVSLRRRRLDAVAASASDEDKAADPSQYYHYYADLASEHGDPELALEWLWAGHRAFPRDWTLPFAEGLLLRRLGKRRAAADSLALAAVLAPATNGEVDYCLAALYAEPSGIMDHAEAFDHLERALRRQPALLGQVEGDPIFAPLRGRSFEDVTEAAAAALRAGDKT